MDRGIDSSHEPRGEDLPVVHPDHRLGPLCAGRQRIKELLVASEPDRRVVEPGALIELDSLDGPELVVEYDLVSAEQGPLVGKLGEHAFEISSPRRACASRQ